MTRLKTTAYLLVLAVLAAGCSATDTLNVSSSSVTNAGSAASSTVPGSTSTGNTVVTGQGTVGAQGGQPVAAIARDARVQFAPVIGAAAEAVPPLSGRLTARAGQRGLTVTPQADGATHIVKGYFSTISDEGGTTVIFVWDVLDPAGNRVHRIQGQEKARGGSGEGWPAVSSATMEAIADRTVDELATWLQGGQTQS